MKCFNTNDMPLKSLQLFEQISIDLNNVIYTIIFKAYAQLNNERAQMIGRKLLNETSTKTYVKNTVWNAVIHMLMHFGDVNGAEDVFKSLKEKSIVSYGTLLEGKHFSKTLLIVIEEGFLRLF